MVLLIHGSHISSGWANCWLYGLANDSLTLSVMTNPSLLGQLSFAAKLISIICTPLVYDPWIV